MWSRVSRGAPASGDSWRVDTWASACCHNNWCAIKIAHQWIRIYIYLHGNTSIWKNVPILSLLLRSVKRHFQQSYSIQHFCIIAFYKHGLKCSWIWTRWVLNRSNTQIHNLTYLQVQVNKYTSCTRYAVMYIYIHFWRGGGGGGGLWIS